MRPKASGGKVGIVGYCWGGLLTWRAACTLSGLSAAVPYYGGGVTTEAETARQPRVPVLAHFADEDKWIPLDTVELSKRHIRKCRCSPMPRTTASTATSEVLGMRLLPSWHGNARWRFSSSIWADWLWLSCPRMRVSMDEGM
jgi:dienelactone hydrolase